MGAVCGVMANRLCAWGLSGVFVCGVVMAAGADRCCCVVRAVGKVSVEGLRMCCCVARVV